MHTSIHRFFLLTIGVLLCLLGCTRDRADILMPDHISHPTAADIKTSFQQNVLPILTARCALSGCHVADGPHGLDFRTYASFIAGGEHGPAFIPGNATESEIVEELVEGKMPPPQSGLPRVPDAEIQVIIDWINQQEPQDDIVLHDDHHGAEEDEHVDMEDEHDAEEDEHVDMDDAHDEDMVDDHDDDDEHDDDMDNGHDDDHDDDDDDDDDDHDDDN